MLLPSSRKIIGTVSENIVTYVLLNAAKTTLIHSEVLHETFTDYAGIH